MKIRRLTILAAVGMCWAFAHARPVPAAAPAAVAEECRLAASESDIPRELDDLALTLHDLDRLRGEKYQTRAARARIAALKSILTGLKMGKVPTSERHLCRSQAQIVRELISLKRRVEAAGDPALEEKFIAELKRKRSLRQVRDVLSPTGPICRELRKA